MKVKRAFLSIVVLTLCSISVVWSQERKDPDKLSLESRKEPGRCVLKYLSDPASEKIEFYLSNSCSVKSHCPGETNPFKTAEIFVGVGDGVYDLLARDISKILITECIDLESVPTAGTPSISEGVKTEENVVFGIVQADIIYWDAKSADKLRVVTELHKEQVHVIGRPGVSEWKDIKTAYSGTVGSGTFHTIKNILEKIEKIDKKNASANDDSEFKSIEIIDLGNKDLVSVLEDFEEDEARGEDEGDIDAIFYVTGSPSEVLANIPDNFNLISMPEIDFDDEKSVYTLTEIPEGSYNWHPGVVTTYGVTALLVTYDWKSLDAGGDSKFSERCVQVRRAHALLANSKVKRFLRVGAIAGKANANWQTFSGTSNIGNWKTSTCIGTTQ